MVYNIHITNSNTTMMKTKICDCDACHDTGIYVEYVVNEMGKKVKKEEICWCRLESSLNKEDDMDDDS